MGPSSAVNVINDYYYSKSIHTIHHLIIMTLCVYFHTNHCQLDITHTNIKLSPSNIHHPLKHISLQYYYPDNRF